jgi:hypothetical protein
VEREGEEEGGAPNMLCSLEMVDPRSIGPDKNIEEVGEGKEVEIELVVAMPGFSNLRYTSLHTSFAQYLM